MKKFLLSAAAVAMSLCANAQLYVVGDGDGLGWTPDAPAEMTLADGNYTLQVTNLKSFKVSTATGSWDEFNAGVYGCDYGDEAGVAVDLEKGFTNNINAPWAGDYTISITEDLTKITLTTETPKPAVAELPSLYFRGDMNEWGVDETWKFEALNSKVFRFVCAEGQQIEAGAEFKIADDSWGKYNIGGTPETDDLLLGVETLVAVGGNPANMIVVEPFNGVAWLNLDIDGKAYLTLSNDKTFEPSWFAGIEAVAADVNAPVVFYNLCGVRVANPENGVFIRVQGNNVAKVLVK